MRYKTILVHVDNSRHAPARIALAAALCGENAAHLIGMATTGIAQSVLPQGGHLAPCPLLASYVDPLRQNAQRALDAFERIAQRHGVSHEARLVCDTTPDALLLLARFADLVVVSQDDPDESLGYMPPAVRMPDHIVFNAARPVLVVPLNTQQAEAAAPACLRRILLCWNGSREASLAMAAALPLLQRAPHVILAIITPIFPGSISSEDLSDTLAYLKRHAVHAELALRDPQRDAGHAILTLAAEQQCDALVMGCFGHSQFHELILGGASRTVLREATLPVLMMR